MLELDSWQLQGFGDLKISPHVAVFTNLMDDHLNYYSGDKQAYFWDKANIFINQKNGDRLVVGAGVLAQIQKAMPPVAPLVPPPLPHDWKLQLIGEHNKENAALAALVLRMLGLSEDEIKSGLESFEPVEGRLQKVAEIKGVTFYNDNNATTPEATIAALRAFDEPVILITGGADKSLQFEELVQEIEQRTATVVLLPGTGTERLKKLLKNYTEVKTMSEAIATVMVRVQSGDVVLFSPAFASFGLFKNEYDRNDQFLAAVKQLK